MFYTHGQRASLKVFYTITAVRSLADRDSASYLQPHVPHAFNVRVPRYHASAAPTRPNKTQPLFTMLLALSCLSRQAADSGQHMSPSSTGFKWSESSLGTNCTS